MCLIYCTLIAVKNNLHFMYISLSNIKNNLHFMYISLSNISVLCPQILMQRLPHAFLFHIVPVMYPTTKAKSISHASILFAYSFELDHRQNINAKVNTISTNNPARELPRINMSLNLGASEAFPDV